MTSAAVLELNSNAIDLVSDHRIETDRLVMRATQRNDLEDYIALMSDPAVMRFVGIDQGKLPTHEEIRTVVNGAVNAWSTRGFGRWSVFDAATGDFVGFSGFRAEGGVPELISIVHEKYWGNGYALEAARAALDYGFSTLSFTVVCSFVRPANVRARALLEKLDAEFVGFVDFYGVEGAAYRIKPS